MRATLAYYRDYMVFMAGELRRLTFIGYASDGISYVFMLYNGDLIETVRVQSNQPLEENNAREQNAARDDRDQNAADHQRPAANGGRRNRSRSRRRNRRAAHSPARPNNEHPDVRVFDAQRDAQQVEQGQRPGLFVIDRVGDVQMASPQRRSPSPHTPPGTPPQLRRARDLEPGELPPTPPEQDAERERVQPNHQPAQNAEEAERDLQREQRREEIDQRVNALFEPQRARSWNEMNEEEDNRLDDRVEEQAAVAGINDEMQNVIAEHVHEEEEHANDARQVNDEPVRHNVNAAANPMDVLHRVGDQPAASMDVLDLFNREMIARLGNRNNSGQKDDESVRAERAPEDQPEQQGNENADGGPAAV